MIALYVDEQQNEELRDLRSASVLGAGETAEEEFWERVGDITERVPEEFSKLISENNLEQRGFTMSSTTVENLALGIRPDPTVALLLVVLPENGTFSAT